jgi:hypothetical protein
VDLFGTVLAALGIEGSPRDGLVIDAGNRAAFEARSTVFMEEHENRIHPLFDHMTIADHIFGFQRRQWRQLVWDGGAECYDLIGPRWIRMECEVGWEQRFEELVAVAALPVERGASTDDAGLTKEMRERLEALGYVR